MDKHKENDYSENHENIVYVIENEVLESSGGFNVDYENSFFAKGFTVRPSYGASGC